jgi:DNA-binding NarL/FixJ family response regulator
MMIDVLLADDHAVVCDGLRALLETETGIRVVGSVGNGRDAVRQAERLQPHVVIMDIAMPLLNGIEATRRICRARPATRVIMLSMHASIEHIYRAIEAGACGFLLKESAGREVAGAVRAVQAGVRYLSRRIPATAVDDYIGKRNATSPLESLSEREREILQLVVEGGSSAQIAQMLSLSPKTVETYRSRLMQKLEIGDIPGLVKFAIQHGLTVLK